MKQKFKKILRGKGKAGLFLIGMMFIIAIFSVSFVSALIFQDAETSYSYSLVGNTWSPSTAYTRAVDENWTSYASTFSTGGNYSIIENYTINDYLYNASWKFKSGITNGVNILVGSGCTEISYWNWTSNNWQIFGSSLYDSSPYGTQCYNLTNSNCSSSDTFVWNCTESIPSDGIYNYQVRTKITERQKDYARNYYEGGILYDNSHVNENSITYNNVTTETTSESFILNLTYSSVYYSVSSADLIYNGTTYSSVKTISGENTIFTTVLSIPSVIGNQENRSFHWDIALTNSTGTFHFNSTFKNQTVNAIALGECSGLNIYKALNITAWNEKTLLRVNPFDLSGTLTYSSSVGGSQKNYSFTNSSIANKEICININGTLYLNGLLEYSNTSYQTKNYYFLDYPVSNNTKSLSLYMLPTASSTSFIIKVQDTNLLPLPNYYVSIFRYSAGNETPYLVQTVKTDINGQSIAFLETETVDYLFEVFDTNGTMVYISDKQRAIPQEAPYTITFTVGTDLPSPLIYLENLTGLTYSLSYDKPKFLVTYTYSDTNTSFVSSQLIVSRNNLTGLDTTICSTTKNDSSGVILCDLTGNSTGSYYATAYITRGSQIFIYRINFEIETFSDTAGLLGVMGGFFIILISCFLFVYNEVAGIISVNIAVIAVNLIGMVHFGGIFITSMIAISIIMAIVLERG